MKSATINLVYLTILFVSLPWLIYRALFLKKNRRGWWTKLTGRILPREAVCQNQKCIWLHAVSVGEVNLLRPLLERLEKRLPDWHFAISTSTETGFRLATEKYSQHQVFYCPMDFSWAINSVIRRLNPSLLLLAELELWPNLIRCASARGVSVVVVNGRLSEQSYRRYQKVSWLVSRVLKKLDWVFAQNSEYAERFRALGAESVEVTGNVKFDGANTDKNVAMAERCRQVAALDDGDIVWVAGSTQPDEDAMVISVWQQLVVNHPRLRLVLVPRHPQKISSTLQLLEAKGISFCTRSAMADSESSDASVLVVDVIGELAGWWALADVGYVGGSMGTRGGQNMVEPAALGVPISYGPNTWNFKQEVRLLAECDGAKVVGNASELMAFLNWFLDSPIAAHQMGKRASLAVAQQVGAADQTVARLLQRLDGDSEIVRANAA